MKTGDWIETPRFLKVKIAEVLTRQEAGEKEYKETTDFRNPEWEIWGKNIAPNRMRFAAVKK